MKKKGYYLKADKRLARILAAELYEKMAMNIQLLDVRRKCDYCNHFLILSGKNKMHLDALREKVREVIRDREVVSYGEEGAPESGWIIIDLGPLIIHIFDPSTRDYYDIFGLWGASTEVELDLPAK